MSGTLVSCLFEPVGNGRKLGRGTYLGSTLVLYCSHVHDMSKLYGRMEVDECMLAVRWYTDWLVPDGKCLLCGIGRSY